MMTIELYFTTFLQTLFCSHDTNEIASYFSPNVCAACTATGEKNIGRKQAASLLLPPGAPFSSCDVIDLDLTNPADSFYCFIADCFLCQQDCHTTCPVRVNASVIKINGTFSIVQIQTSLLEGDLALPEYQKQALNPLYDNIRQNQKRFEAAIQHCGLSLWEYDISNRCIYQKENSVNMHGLESKIERVPDSLIESGYVHPDSIADFSAMYRQLLDGAEKAGGIFQVKNADQKEYWWEKITYITEFDENHIPVTAHGFSTDVTERMQVQQELKRVELQKQLLERRTLLNMVVDLTADQVIGVKVDHLFSLAPNEPVTYEDILALLSCSMMDAGQKDCISQSLDVQNLIHRYELGDENTYLDLLCRRINQEPIWVQFVLHISASKENGHLIGEGYVEDIDKRKKIEMDLKTHAELDGLTQIYNRKTFQMLADNILSARNKDKLVIFGIMDIDNFKAINDCYGHTYGDSALKKAAAGLKDAFANEGFVGRLGGDEFIFAFSDFLELNLLKKKLDTLFAYLQTPDSMVGIPIYVSIGIAIVPWDGNKFDTLYEKADTALYHVKKRGKNGWQAYQNNMDMMES